MTRVVARLALILAARRADAGFVWWQWMFCDDKSSFKHEGRSGPMDHSRLSMPLGEAIFTQRSIRRFKPDPIPMEDIHLIVEAAVRAPNGGNQQVARLLVVMIARRFGSSASSIMRHGGRSAATPGTTRSRTSRRTTAPPPG